MKAAVLMATPCTKSLGGGNWGQEPADVLRTFLYSGPCFLLFTVQMGDLSITLDFDHLRPRLG